MISSSVVHHLREPRAPAELDAHVRVRRLLLGPDGGEGVLVHGGQVARGGDDEGDLGLDGLELPDLLLPRLDGEPHHARVHRAAPSPHAHAHRGHRRVVLARLLHHRLDHLLLLHLSLHHRGHARLHLVGPLQRVVDHMVPEQPDEERHP
jgi:hypothetical protein